MARGPTTRSGLCHGACGTTGRRGQADALWRPSVNLPGAVGVAGSDSDTRGAQFSASGFGTSHDVAFHTSIDSGIVGHTALSASLPLYSRERDAQARQLTLAADSADLQWQEAQQTLMLSTAQRYFDVLLAGESLRVLRQQQITVDRAGGNEISFRAG